MRALVFDGEQPRLVSHHREPEPAPGEALVRTLRAGMTSVDGEICQGMLGFTGVLGHEFVGIVESIEDDDHRLLGKRVVGSITSACGRCDLCLGGLSRHCRHRTILGMDGRDGCLADRFTIPLHNLVRVPDSVDDDHAVFAQLLSSAIQAARQLTIEGKPYITVLGDGPLGLLMVQVMAKLNASVRLVGHYSEKLAVCEKWGIKHRHLDDVGRRADQDVVVDCTGTSTGLEVALQLVRPRGKVVLKTLVSSTARVAPGVDLTPVVLNEIEIIGSHDGPVSEAIAMLERREIDVVSLITRRMKLDEGAAILRAAFQPGVVKVLVTT